MTTPEKRAARSVYGGGDVVSGSGSRRHRAVQKRIERAAKRGSRAEEMTFERETETPASGDMKREVDAEPPPCHGLCCGGLDP